MATGSPTKRTVLRASTGRSRSGSPPGRSGYSAKSSAVYTATTPSIASAARTSIDDDSGVGLGRHHERGEERSRSARGRRRTVPCPASSRGSSLRSTWRRRGSCRLLRSSSGHLGPSGRSSSHVGLDVVAFGVLRVEPPLLGVLLRLLGLRHSPQPSSRPRKYSGPLSSRRHQRRWPPWTRLRYDEKPTATISATPKNSDSIHVVPTPASCRPFTPDCSTNTANTVPHTLKRCLNWVEPRNAAANAGSRYGRARLGLGRAELRREQHAAERWRTSPR